MGEAWKHPGGGKLGDREHPQGWGHGASLTFQVPVKVLEPPHLTISLVPHGFLQGFPLGRGLDKVFIILRDALDLALQLGRRNGQARVRYAWNEERKGRCWPKLTRVNQPNPRAPMGPPHGLAPSAYFGEKNGIFCLFCLQRSPFHRFWLCCSAASREQPPLVRSHTKGFLWWPGMGGTRRGSGSLENRLLLPSPGCRAAEHSCSGRNEPPEGRRRRD